MIYVLPTRVQGVDELTLVPYVHAPLACFRISVFAVNVRTKMGDRLRGSGVRRRGSRPPRTGARFGVDWSSRRKAV
ncbi:MAG TPA: hypothetical protein VG457_19675 [Planctomycetota bacterium]|nr:hypothetical protein [Planctomycetota bacterium]